MIGIFLDDERNPEDVFWIDYPEITWSVVRTKAEFDELVQLMNVLGQEYVVSFDHDIQEIHNGVEITGYDCLISLVDFCLDTGAKLPVSFFHTQNPVGKQNMQSYYENSKKHLG
jgi:hypothetical protein